MAAMKGSGRRPPPKRASGIGRPPPSVRGRPAATVDVPDDDAPTGRGMVRARSPDGLRPVRGSCPDLAELPPGVARLISAMARHAAERIVASEHARRRDNERFGHGGRHR